MAQSEHVIEVTEATFQTDVIARSRQTPVVVDFWAPWCGPCHMLGRVLDKLVREYNGGFILARVNTDENQRLAMQFDIQGIPAVKAFRDGKVAAEFTGALPEPQVRQFLQRLAQAPAAQPTSTAEALLAAGRFAEAEAAFRQAGAGNGSTPAAELGLARALLAQGKGAAARMVLEKAAAGAESDEAQALLPLADLLLEAQEGTGGEGEPDKLYRRAAALASGGDARGAMDVLLQLLRANKSFRGGAARQAMLAIFAFLGEENPLVREYRAKLASVLF